MSKKYKILVRLISCALSAALVFDPWIVPVAWAEGEESTASGDQVTPTPEPSVPPAGPDPAPTDLTPAAETTTASVEPTGILVPTGDSSITTGDAQSTAQVETTANVNQDCLPGQVSDPASSCTPPTVTMQPSDCGNEGINSLGNDNTATISGEAASSASTGTNEITNSSGDANLVTGDATASGEITNLANTNTVIIGGSTTDDSSEETDLSGAEEATEEATEQTTPSGLLIENQNQAQVDNQEAVTASTGENQANDNLGSATIVTGKAMALANLLNFLNSNIAGSNFEIVLINNLEGTEGSINLNEIWKEILSQTGEDWQLVEQGGHFLLVKNQNQADLVNNVLVTAETGSNQANDNGNGATIITADATALANVINLINLNLLGSKFFLGVINLLGDFSGDLILPRPEMFLTADLTITSETESNGSPILFDNNNQAQIEDSVVTQANSGSNQADNNSGDNLMTTGDAQSQANSMVVANTNILYNNWFFLVINHLGSWLGKIFGWASPEGIEDPGEGISQLFELSSEASGNQESVGEADNLEDNESTPGAMIYKNQASLKNNLSVNANTGSNQANNNQGGTSIRTGKATALANLFDLVNLNIWGSRWFMGIVNILGNWTGNVVFAYPDVAVALTNGGGEVLAGGTTHFNVNYQNQGYDEASNAWAKIELPKGIDYLSDNSGLLVTIDGSNCSWFLGNLAVGESGSFQIEVQVQPERPTANQTSFFNKLLARIFSPVWAVGEGSWTVVAVATVGTDTPESNLSNNTSSAKTIIYQEELDGGEPGLDQRQPKLEISAWNNVSDFVYPGDTVTFEITIKNTSDVEARDTYIVQELANGIPYKNFGAAGFDIGTIEPDKQIVLSFGLKLANDGVLPAGFYHTTALAYAYAPNGEEVVSNQAKTNFKIQWRQIASVLEAKAVGKEEEVLAAACLPEKEDLLPYLLALLVSSLWLVERSRKRFNFTQGGSRPVPDGKNDQKTS